ncbi:MAG TPA: hypothetical protein VFO95_13135, partial [Gemmatimonadales bacterium]|nr:hypothetical protein [Gemmatimonadales bacterium]
MHLPATRVWLALIVGCGDGGTAPAGPPTSLPSRLGDLEIITTGSGPGADPDGYDLIVNGVVQGTMDPEDTLRIVSVPAADYLIGL